MKLNKICSCGIELTTKNVKAYPNNRNNEMLCLNCACSSTATFLQPLKHRVIYKTKSGASKEKSFYDLRKALNLFAKKSNDFLIEATRHSSSPIIHSKNV